ncbi:MAG: zinc ABC transporter substrate-binding protein [Bdellovibrionaceae bacterium]|nr:zinc ABC transporter substrate-binding protein [Pseudobdellovibrionaceae bacterium]
MKLLLQLLIVALFPVLSFAEPKTVIVSFSVLENLVQEIAPASLTVKTLVPSGRDAHQYEATAQDLVRLKKAPVVFSIGASFEPWLAKALRAIKYPGTHIVLTKGLRLLPGGHHGWDPHVWLNPELTKEMIKTISKELQEIVPEDKAEIQTKEKAYLAQLDSLHRELKESLAKIPPDRRRAVVSHEAFGYFTQAYGIEFVAPQGWSTESEPTANDVARIIRDVKTKKAKAIFSENLADRKTVEQIAQETGLKVGGVLSVDSLTSKAPSYTAMMRENVRVLVEALSQ